MPDHPESPSVDFSLLKVLQFVANPLSLFLEYLSSSKNTALSVQFSCEVGTDFCTPTFVNGHLVFQWPESAFILNPKCNIQLVDLLCANSANQSGVRRWIQFYSLQSLLIIR